MPTTVAKQQKEEKLICMRVAGFGAKEPDFT
jgi:hypothetical protein